AAGARDLSWSSRTPAGARLIRIIVRRTRDTPYGPGPTHEPVSPREPTPPQPLLPPARLGRQRVERRGVLRGGRAAALRKPRPVSSGSRAPPDIGIIPPRQWRAQRP